VGEATSLLQIETEDTIAASTSVPSPESLSKLEEARNEDANLLQANGATIQDSNTTKREERERIAKQHAVSEMHRLFAEEVSRGGTPTGNAVKALRRLAETAQKYDQEMFSAMVL
jgi:cysteine synthase